MNTFDNELRMFIYQTIVANGQAPEVETISEQMKATLSIVKASMSRLHNEHIIVLHPAGHPDEGEVAFAQPFANMKTGYTVRTKSGEWFAPCIWDSFGIAAALKEEAEIITSCPDCHEKITIPSGHQPPVDYNHVVHFLLPAKQWWHDIFYT